MNKLLVICGPTATGKTALGIKLALKFGGELVSADSRQIYKGMNIGTGKDLPVNSRFKVQNSKLNFKSKNLTIGFYEINGIRVWLYDMVEPDYRFSLADYVKCASLVIKDIWRRGKIPIVVGGTGFYIKGLIDEIESLGIPPDWELREKLRKWKLEELQKEVRKITPERWEKLNESDRNNPRRLIRIIEISKNFSGSEGISRGNLSLEIDKLLMIGLRAPYKFLYKRIDQRVKKRINQGLEKEINNLIEEGYNWENSVLGATIGYKEWQDFFEGRITRNEAIKRWQFAEHAYVRRQMIWFKKDLRIFWFDISKKEWQNKVEELIIKWLDEANSS